MYQELRIDYTDIENNDDIMNEYQILSHAIMERNDNMVKYLLSHISDNELMKIDAKYKYLELASLSGNTSYLDLLLSKGCKLKFNERTCDNGMERVIVYEMVMAVQNKQHQVVKYFLDNNLIPKNIVSNVLSSLMACTVNPEIDFYKFLIRKYIDVNDVLFISNICSGAQVDIFKFLIKMGADINYSRPIKNHFSPKNEIFHHNALSDAILSNNINMVKEVINLGVDLTMCYHTIYHHCLIGSSSLDIINYLDKNYSEYIHLISYDDQFAMACLRGDMILVKSMFDNSPKNKYINERGLFVAHYSNHYSIVNFLIEKMRIQNCKQLNNIISKISKVHPLPWGCGGKVGPPALEVLGKCCARQDFDLVESDLYNKINEENALDCFQFLMEIHNPEISRKFINILTQKKIKIVNNKVFKKAIFRNHYVILDYLIGDKPVKKNALKSINLNQPVNKILRMISYLVDKGADVNHKYKLSTCIIEKIITFRMYVTDFIIYTRNNNDVPDNDKYDLFYKKTDQKILDVIAHLVKLGFQFDDSSASRSLMFALYNHLFKVAQYISSRLINTDVNTAMTNYFTNNKLFYSNIYGDEIIKQHLIDSIRAFIKK